MTRKIKTNTGVHETQKEHTAGDCCVNDAPHNHPDTDCGHYVPSGPGYQMDEDAKDGPGVQIDTDSKTGPGVQ